MLTFAKKPSPEMRKPEPGRTIHRRRPSIAGETPRGAAAYVQRKCSGCQADDTENWIQAKLIVGAPNDRYEREADAVAEQVMRSTSPNPVALRANDEPVLRPKCAACADEQTDSVLQRKLEPPGPDRAGEAKAGKFDAQLASARSWGQPLPDSVREFMEPRFRRSFADVRVHTGPATDRLAEGLRARAFTVGRDIFVRAREYAPAQEVGRRLLAHELTHVVQQTGPRSLAHSPARVIQRAISEPDEQAERPAPVSPEQSASRVDIITHYEPSTVIDDSKPYEEIGFPGAGIQLLRENVEISPFDPKSTSPVRISLTIRAAPMLACDWAYGCARDLTKALVESKIRPAIDRLAASGAEALAEQQATNALATAPSAAAGGEILKAAVQAYHDELIRLVSPRTLFAKKELCDVLARCPFHEKIDEDHHWNGWPLGGEVFARQCLLDRLPNGVPKIETSPASQPLNPPCDEQVQKELQKRAPLAIGRATEMIDQAAQFIKTPEAIPFIRCFFGGDAHPELKTLNEEFDVRRTGETRKERRQNRRAERRENRQERRERRAAIKAGKSYTIEHVRSVIAEMKRRFDKLDVVWSCTTQERCDKIVGETVSAFASSGNIVFCPDSLNSSREELAELVIHEMAHISGVYPRYRKGKKLKEQYSLAKVLDVAATDPALALSNADNYSEMIVKIVDKFLPPSCEES